MNNVEAINLKNKKEAMLVTWDTGRRCNYDCTYCESTRHDNHSSFTTLEDLTDTFNFIKEYTSIYNSYRQHKPSHTNINFTGGEPTLNPNFWELVDLIKEDKQPFHLSLTTNGAWNKKYSKLIKNKFDAITVSYHAEGHPELKKLVLENIDDIKKDSDLRLQVNVMLHEKYWNECVSVYDKLIKKDIDAKPRPIGDGNIHRPGWFRDLDGSWRKTTHEYSNDQKKWFFDIHGIDKNSNDTKHGDELGRSCCGGRCLSGKLGEEWRDVSIVDNHFHNWYCTINWFFLHIEQHTREIYHHQTCQALHSGRKGSIGTLDSWTSIVKNLKKEFAEGKILPIQCPNKKCGCGLCAPKAKYAEDFKEIWREVSTLYLDL